jgi:pSer/pThr/pTyr-binding forkhead associated (FHA) protein
VPTQRQSPNGPATPTVTLRFKHGGGDPGEYTFDERSTCVIGRGEDCTLRLPNDEIHRSVSRHHCMLDINPPAVRIRDFDSRNGTFVNGERIGRPDSAPGPASAPRQGPDGDRSQDRDLMGGDEVRLGRSVAFEVVVTAPTPPPGPSTVSLAGGAGEETLSAPPGCARCGREVSREVGTWDGEAQYLCEACRASPEEVATLLVSLARAGDDDLRAIAEYTLYGELGRGGMGAVYLARHSTTGRRVALKLMLPRSAASADARARFQREVRLTRMLGHPNIAPLYEDGFADGAFFFTSEYCEGGSLDKLLERRGGRLPTREAVRYAIEALEGLDYAHGKGVVHRDLSPSNILLARRPGLAATADDARRQFDDRPPNDDRPLYQAKVADFGLAKAFDRAGFSGLTRSGTTAGKPWYLSRQQVLNFKDASYDVDVWALAACLYRALTGAYVREFPPDVDQWHVILYSDAVPIRQRDANVPRALAKVVDRALREHPRIGFSSAAELREELRRVWPSI